MNSGRIRIGTRGSTLALKQVELVSAALRKSQPGLEIETEIITTKGDINQSPIPVDTIGKAWFTAEIEEALLEKRIDLAIHSLKDVPPEIPAGMLILPVLAREDARDVFISNDGSSVATIKHGALIGTDSTRRRAQLLHQRPDLRVESVRGNVETRIKKLRDGQYDALVLAAAGIKRLGLEEVITEYLDMASFVPASGQGVLAAECAADDQELISLLRSIQDESTRTATIAEQAFIEVIGGGCKLPIGCYAEVRGDQIHIYGMRAEEDGSNVRYESTSGSAEDGQMLAETLAEKLKEARI